MRNLLRSINMAVSLVLSIAAILISGRAYADPISLTPNPIAAGSTNTMTIVASNLSGQDISCSIMQIQEGIYIIDNHPISNGDIGSFTFTFTAPPRGINLSYAWVGKYTEVCEPGNGDYNLATGYIYVDDVVSNAPSAPTNLTASSPAQRATLNWDAVSNATSYNVFRNDIQVATTSTNSYVDSPSDGTYSYYVTAVNSEGQSSGSNSQSVVVDRTRPNLAFVNPSVFSGIYSEGPTVTINGYDTGSGLKNLVIHVYNSSGQLLNTCGTATPAQLASGSQSCSLASLPNGTYYIKAGTFDNAGNNKTINSGNFVILN